MVIGLLVVALVLVAGLAVYTSIHSKKTATVAISPSPSPSKSPSPSPSPTSQQGYFAITQWGVRAPYDGTDTFTVQINTGSLATIVSKQLAAKYSGCTTYGAGQIKRLAPTDGAYADGSGPHVQDYAKQNPGMYTFVNGYYYQFVHDQAVCDMNSADMQNQANDTVKSLVGKLQPSS